MNKYLIPFDIPDKVFTNLSQLPNLLWLGDQYKMYEKMNEWCKYRIGDPGFPRWEFQLHSSFTTHGAPTSTLYSGIFIYDDEARVAFKLTFGV
jgi:hypothetical protein